MNEMEVDKIRDYYSNEVEKNRLELEIFKLEAIRTKEIIGRYLSKGNLSILDIGGGAGYYAFWVQEKGHDVTLVDLSSKNIELVSEYTQRNAIHLTNFEEGDATHLNFSENQFDMDGFKRDLITDTYFEKLLKKDLECGIHLNETDNLEYFTTAYFHTPADIREEIRESGLKFGKLIAVESFGWVIDNFESKSNDPSYMEKPLYFIKEVESREDLIAMSPHIIAVAEKE
jgi:SAM-dependent methyltransferase